MKITFHLATQYSLGIDDQLRSFFIVCNLSSNDITLYIYIDIVSSYLI